MTRRNNWQKKNAFMDLSKQSVIQNIQRKEVLFFTYYICDNWVKNWNTKNAEKGTFSWNCQLGCKSLTVL